MTSGLLRQLPWRPARPDSHPASTQTLSVSAERASATSHALTHSFSLDGCLDHFRMLSMKSTSGLTWFWGMSVIREQQVVFRSNGQQQTIGEERAPGRDKDANPARRQCVSKQCRHDRCCTTSNSRYFITLLFFPNHLLRGQVLLYAHLCFIAVSRFTSPAVRSAHEPAQGHPCAFSTTNHSRVVLPFDMLRHTKDTPREILSDRTHELSKLPYLRSPRGR